jgi:hypothetical protein
MLLVYDAFNKWDLGCSACFHQVFRQFRSYIKADLQSLISFTTTVPTVQASVAGHAVLRKSRLLSLQSKLPYIWISPATHLTADLKCCSSSSISCSTHGRLQSWRPCCPCSWSGAFSWIYCTPVPRLLQYMLHCLLSLPRSRLQRYLHLDQPSINWPNIYCSAYSWIYCTPVLLLLPQYRLLSLLLNYHRLQVLLPLKHPLQYRLSLQSWCSCCLYS